MEYITLDDETLRKQAIEDPKLFLEEHPAPLFIDEVQYVPGGYSLLLKSMWIKKKNEIDLIFYKNNKLYPFEIKKIAISTKEMIMNFQKLENTNKEIGTGGIICFYDTLMKIEENNYIIPISSVINAN